jgi:trehalose/maltose transport system substrate-binding protein
MSVNVNSSHPTTPALPDLTQCGEVAIAATYSFSLAGMRSHARPSLRRTCWLSLPIEKNSSMSSQSTPSHRPWFGSALLLSLSVVLFACPDEKEGGGADKAPARAAPSAAAPSAPTAVTTATVAAAAPGGGTTKEKPPAVPAATEAKKYSGAKITYYGDSVGTGAEFDKILATKFTEDTSIQVTVIPRPKDATETYATYQRLFQSQSAGIDVMMLDVIWPGAFAANLIDLGPKLGEAAKLHVENIVKNNTVNGKLVAIPWFTDFGMLYYRTDLLQKYGYSKPPETWDELEQMAKKIQDGERAASQSFAGFVWQGNGYEGLTCDALEWIYSQGGGMIIEDKKTTVNNPQAAKALARAKGWVGSISPSIVTSYGEEESRNAFQGGNAAFMRNWPYAYSAGNDEKSPIKGKFDVAPLPHNPGQKSAGTVGGWQIGVSRFSKSADAAIEFARYLTSPEVQKYRAVNGSFLPTIPAVQADPDVVKALPFLAKLKGVSLVPRPSNVTGERYNEASVAFFEGVSQVLAGKEPGAILKQVEERIQRTLR